MSAATLEPKAPADGLPVFVAKGRRRYRAVRVGKVALGIALAGWLAALCAGLIGFAPLPLPALSGSDDGQAVSAVRAQSADPRPVGPVTRRGPGGGGSGDKSSTAARRGGDAGGGPARSTTGTSDSPARTPPPSAGVAQTASTTGSSSNHATSPQPTSIPRPRPRTLRHRRPRLPRPRRLRLARRARPISPPRRARPTGAAARPRGHRPTRRKRLQLQIPRAAAACLAEDARRRLVRIDRAWAP